jgi:hypothetical protein
VKGLQLRGAGAHPVVGVAVIPVHDAACEMLRDGFSPVRGLISDNEPDVATGRQRPNTSCKQLANLLQLRPPNRRLPSAHIAFVCG